MMLNKMFKYLYLYLICFKPGIYTIGGDDLQKLVLPRILSHSLNGRHQSERYGGRLGEILNTEKTCHNLCWGILNTHHVIQM